MKRTSILSIAAVVAASAFALQAPVASAADNSASGTQKGVPGVDVDVGKNASDKGVPGVEMNVGKDGDQKNVGKDKTSTDTSTLGAGSDKAADTKDAKPSDKKRVDKN